MNWFKKHSDLSLFLVYLIFAIVVGHIGTWSNCAKPYPIFDFPNIGANFVISLPRAIVTLFLPLYWLVVLISIFSFDHFLPNELLVGVLLVFAASVMIVVGWYVREKKRSIWWILLAFAPLAGVMYWYLKRNEMK
jgi:hypothetical protein